MFDLGWNRTHSYCCFISYFNLRRVSLKQKKWLDVSRQLKGKFRFNTQTRSLTVYGGILLVIILWHSVIIQMKEAITALSKQQNIILQELFNHLHLDTLTASKTQKYYRELRRLTTNSHHQPIPLDNIMKAAILIAEQSQELYNLKGERMCGVHLALNEIIRSTNNFKGVVSALKIYLSYSKSMELQLREDIVGLIEQLTFGNNFAVKFKKAIEYFDFVEVQDHYNYRNLFQSFSWLLFINMHSQIPTNNHVEVDYLLISVLYLMVRYVHPYLRPRKMAAMHNNKTLIASIIEQLFSIFIIQDPASFKKINSEVDAQFQQLISSEIIKCRFQYDFLSPSLIRNNYKKLDTMYQRKRETNSIDLRMFLANRFETLTPVKHSRVSPHNPKQKTHNKNQSFASHKILNFQNEIESKVCIPVNSKEIKLPSNVRVSPSYIKTPLLCANKISPTMSIELFMAKTVKNNRYRLESLDNQVQVLQVIELIVRQLQFSGDILKEKTRAVFNYYIVLQTKFLNEEEYQQEDLNGIYCSALVHALLLVAAEKRANEEQIQSFIRTSIREITRQIEVSGHHLWVLCKFMLKQAIQYPPILKQLLYSLEMQCINQYIWRDASIRLIQKYFINQNQRHFLFTPLVHRIKKELKNMSYKLSVTTQFCSYQRLIQSQVFGGLIYTIINYPDIIFNRHLHQIFLCTCYRVLKAQQPETRFNDLIQQHQLVNSISNEQLKYIICKVKLCNAGEQSNQVNIIEFYNKCYLSFAKLLPTRFEEEQLNSIKKQSKTTETATEPQKHHHSSTKLALSNRLSSQESRKMHSLHNHIRNTEFHIEQLYKHEQKPSKELKGLHLEQQARDETRQRERRTVVGWHWQQTEKGKNVNCLK